MMPQVAGLPGAGVTAMPQLPKIAATTAQRPKPTMPGPGAMLDPVPPMSGAQPAGGPFNFGVLGMAPNTRSGSNLPSPAIGPAPTTGLPSRFGIGNGPMPSATLGQDYVGGPIRLGGMAAAPGAPTPGSPTTNPTSMAGVLAKYGSQPHGPSLNGVPLDGGVFSAQGLSDARNALGAGAPPPGSPLAGPGAHVDTMPPTGAPMSGAQPAGGPFNFGVLGMAPNTRSGSNLPSPAIGPGAHVDTMPPTTLTPGGGGTTGSLATPGGGLQVPAAPSSYATLQATDPNNPLTSQTILPGAGTDFNSLIGKSLNAEQMQEQPYFQSALRDASRQAAAGGSLGSGELQSHIGDVTNQYLNNLTAAGQNQAVQGAYTQNENQYRNLAQLTGQQQFQNQQQQQAFGDAAGQANAGFAGNPALTDEYLSGVFGNQASGAGQALSNLMGSTQANASQNQMMQLYQKYLPQLMGGQSSGGSSSGGSSPFLSPGSLQSLGLTGLGG